MSEAIKVEHQSKGLLLASWRNVSFNVWRRTMDTPGLRVARAHLKALRQQFPKGYFTMVCFPEDGRDIRMEISDALRSEVGDIVREANGAVLASAIVLEGSGFFVATMRTAGSGLALLSRPTYPVKFYGAVDAAAAWISPLSVGLSTPFSNTELTDAAREALAKG